ncbi:MAG: hypothetical protein BWY94_02176 [Actinobacteria bacterium ADurb.BinA094]|nr:MAG: hypothetical protein BWY94_02176 [Actinobacteria bacterium ADurb.BinA094]
MLGDEGARSAPPGLALLALPLDPLLLTTANLAEMPWVPPSHTHGSDGFVQRFHGVGDRVLST